MFFERWNKIIMIIINILFGRGDLAGPGNRNRKSESAIWHRCCQLAEISAIKGYNMWARQSNGRYCACSKLWEGLHYAMLRKIQFKTGLQISLEVKQICRISYLFWRNQVFTLQLGDHFFLNLNSDKTGPKGGQTSPRVLPSISLNWMIKVMKLFHSSGEGKKILVRNAITNINIERLIILSAAVFFCFGLAESSTGC
jgi:hypothetical protein